MAPPGVLEEFIRYIQNDIPIRLIHIPTMRFVDRSFIERYFQQSIEEAVTEDAIKRSLYADLSRTSVIRDLIQNIVRYAILSHRWMQAGEPTYKDIKRSRATGAGYDKLRTFCDKAKSYGVEFVWSDTCCIDKSSSSELDESIRSMFRWYRNSAICIVHLAQTTKPRDLKRDEWLKRGWTLQELLAPWRMKFFNKDWQALSDQRNDKYGEIMSLIGRTTGIKASVLRRFDPSPTEVDERMTWAAGRKTTRGEDMAYSLMAIFDVSLAIAYGEGADRAFCRLIEAIMQAGDRSVLNWSGKPAKHPTSRALPASPASYVGFSPLYPELSYGSVKSHSALMTMTSQGLRVPLVLLPLDISTIASSPTWARNLLRPVTFRCPLYPNSADITLNLLIDDVPKTCRFALGIINYISRGKDRTPGICRDCVSYLLRRNGGETVAGDFVGLRALAHSYDTGNWRKIDTGFITFQVPDIPDNSSILYVDRNYLETVIL